MQTSDATRMNTVGQKKNLKPVKVIAQKKTYIFERRNIDIRIIRILIWIDCIARQENIIQIILIVDALAGSSSLSSGWWLTIVTLIIVQYSILVSGFRI